MFGVGVNSARKGDIYGFNMGKRQETENVTSHKIAVVIFIREFCILRKDRTIEPKYRRDFCTLVLKLIQCPDLEFKELENLLTSDKYNLLSVHLQNFCTKLKQIYDEGVNALMDCVSDTIEKLMIEPQETNPCIISKTSVLGLYFRRMSLYLDTLSFSQVTLVYRSFCNYYEKGRPGSLLRCLSKDKLNLSEIVHDYPMTSEEKKFLISVEGSKKKIERDRNFEHYQWSRKQAELFTALQANLLQSSEPHAMPPAQLQETISQILRDNPDYADAHFLSYLNCIREREFCGALDSLYSCFDRSVPLIKPGSSGNPSNTDRNRGFRYASLNLAVLHTQFGHKEQALIALKESMIMSQEAGDNLCLQQAAGWTQRVDGLSSQILPPSRISKLNAPCARHRAALAAQAYVQHAVSRKITPANLFTSLMKGDVVHCQHSMTDLVQISLANRAVLWSLYGKMEMASLCCQLLLNLNTSAEWESEAACLAICGTAQMMAMSGHRNKAAAILQHARARAPKPPHCSLWMRTQYIIAGNSALLTGRLQEAEEAANQLASIDRWESQLMKAELNFLKSEPVNATLCIDDVLNNCNSEDESQIFLTIRIRAMILAAQVENSCGGIHAASSGAITILNEALSLAVNNFLYYQAAIIEMHVANVQLQLGCLTNALIIVQRVLVTIMAHGGPYDQARAMLLYVKCRIACAPKSKERRFKVLTLCTEILDQIKDNFKKVEAINRTKDTLYLQAQLYNEIGNVNERNKCALEFRQIDEQYPTKLMNSLLTWF